MVFDVVGDGVAVGDGCVGIDLDCEVGSKPMAFPADLDFADSAYVERDLALINVGVAPDQRGQVIELANLFRAKIVDVSPASMLIELAGTEEKIEKFVELMKPFGISESMGQRLGSRRIASGFPPMKMDCPVWGQGGEL